MLVLIPRFIKNLKKFYKRNSRRISQFPVLIKLMPLVVLLVLIPFVQSRAEKSSFETNIKFDPNSPEILVLADKQVKVTQSLSRAEVADGLDNIDREIIKSYMQDLGREYGVDWRLVYAIGYLESGNYNSSLARNQYNFFGRKASSGSYASWGSVEEAIQNQFEYLKTRYIDRGMDTPYEMNHVYAESDTWGAKVTGIMNSL